MSEELREKLRGQAEYMTTGGPHGGVPVKVETDSDVWRTAVDLLRAAEAEIGKLARIISIQKRAINRWMPCPDCCDKVESGKCLRCALQSAETEIARLKHSLESVDKLSLALWNLQSVANRMLNLLQSYGPADHLRDTADTLAKGISGVREMLAAAPLASGEEPK